MPVHADARPGGQCSQRWPGGRAGGNGKQSVWNKAVKVPLSNRIISKISSKMLFPKRVPKNNLAKAKQFRFRKCTAKVHRFCTPPFFGLSRLFLLSQIFEKPSGRYSRVPGIAPPALRNEAKLMATALRNQDRLK
jgi:hypothetical protein